MMCTVPRVETRMPDCSVSSRIRVSHTPKLGSQDLILQSSDFETTFLNELESMHKKGYSLKSFEGVTVFLRQRTIITAPT